MVIKSKFKKLSLPKQYLTNDSCNDPTVKLVATALLEYVIKNPVNPCITYAQLSRLCQGKVHYRNLDEPLGKISDLCIINNLPPVSAVVYNQNENRCGAGFFKYFYPHLPECDWDKQFVECIKQVMDCDTWEEFLKIFE